MGQASRRGTFEQRKAQRLAKQYGMTNLELQEAYAMNRRYDHYRYRESRANNGWNEILNLLLPGGGCL